MCEEATVVVVIIIIIFMLSFGPRVETGLGRMWPLNRERQQAVWWPRQQSAALCPNHSGRAEQKMTCSALRTHLSRHTPLRSYYRHTKWSPCPHSGMGVVASILKDRAWQKGMGLSVDSEEPCSNMNLPLTSHVDLGEWLDDPELHLPVGMVTTIAVSQDCCNRTSMKLCM